MLNHSSCYTHFINLQMGFSYSHISATKIEKWSGRLDSNQRPPCAQGERTHTTGGSGRPLPLVFLRKFAIWGNCRKPRAATDCSIAVIKPIKDDHESDTAPKRMADEGSGHAAHPQGATSAALRTGSDQRQATHRRSSTIATIARNPRWTTPISIPARLIKRYVEGLGRREVLTLLRKNPVR